MWVLRSIASISVALEVLSPSWACADDARTQDRDSTLVTANMRSVMHNCLRRRLWTHVQCGFHKELRDAKYQRSQLLKVVDATQIENIGTRSLSEWIERGAGLAVNPLSPSVAGTTTGDETRDFLIHNMKRLQAENQLDECQSACLATCVSSHLLTYDHDHLDAMKTASLPDIYRTQSGVCTEFSAVGNDLAQSLGVRSYYVTTDTHAFLAFHFDQGWYYAEPQDSGCDFYEAE